MKLPAFVFEHPYLTYFFVVPVVKTAVFFVAETLLGQKPRSIYYIAGGKNESGSDAFDGGQDGSLLNVSGPAAMAAGVAGVGGGL